LAQKILIIEDEPDLVATLEYSLAREGYAVQVALSGRDGLEKAAARPVPGLVLLDLMLPDISGLEVCRALRREARTRSVPVIMLTARGEEIDRVVGFEVGADDYVTKPFSVRELILRVRAVLRREQAGDGLSGVLHFGALRFDAAGRRAWVDGVPLELTLLELRLLKLFLSRRGQVLDRDALLSGVWGLEGALNERSVDKQVQRLRQKLGPAGRYLETLRGAGYRFRREPPGGR